MISVWLSDWIGESVWIRVRLALPLGFSWPVSFLQGSGTVSSFCKTKIAVEMFCQCGVSPYEGGCDLNVAG